MKKVSIIYSFRNESSLLNELYDRTIKVLTKLETDFEIIFVNDNSSDNSKEILIDICKKDKRNKLVNMSSRFGQIECLYAGLELMSGDCAVYLDSDLQDPPELIIEMVKKWKEGHDVIHTIRKSRKGENMFKMFLTKIGYKLWSKLSSVDLDIEAGDFKLIDKSVVNAVLAYKEENPFLRAIVKKVGHKQTNIEYDRDPRHSGETHFSFWGGDPIETFFIGLSSFSITPLYFSFVFLFFAVIILAIYCVSSLVNGSFDLFQFSILSFFTLQFLCFGVLGIYIGRIHLQSRGRPLYNIHSKINFE